MRSVLRHTDKMGIDRFINSRDHVLQSAQGKAEEVLDASRLSTFTFNDTIVFVLRVESDEPSLKEMSAFFKLLRKFMIDSFENGIFFAAQLQSEPSMPMRQLIQ